MSLLNEALRAGHAPAAKPHRTGPAVLLAGGAGALGSAVLENLLASPVFRHVAVLVTQPLQVSLQGLRSVPWPDDSPVARSEAVAVVVFDRSRHANGRERAFFRPVPEALTELAQRLKLRGVRHLLVVMPHDPGSLPDALRAGLANLDEQAVSALGFEHVLIVRSAQSSVRVSAAHAVQRLAHWMLSYVQVMVPQRDQPVRAIKVAQLVAQLACRLAASPPGTRVLPPEMVWEAAQATDVSLFAERWLSGQALPAMTPPRLRM